jgi:hypothetical protein
LFITAASGRDCVSNKAIETNSSARQTSGSSLKKRTQKLLLLVPVVTAQPKSQYIKVFLLPLAAAFFQEETLFLLPD